MDDPLIITSSGNGYGYYTRANLQMVFPFRVIAGAGLIYEYEGQQFKEATEKIDAHKLQGSFLIGYKF